MRINYAAKTDVGMKRDNNEDNLLVFPEQNVFAVFDGMGGHAAGEVANAFPQKNIILRALGQQKIVDVEVSAFQPHPGDIFMLCSDGLSGMVSDEMMQAILQKTSVLDAAAKKLIDTANANGGIDNVTVILAQFV